jgi:hypothetical protein
MFDFSNAEDVKSSTLPKGNYHVSVTNAELKNSQAGNPMLKLEYTVQDGTYKGRKLWKSFMLEHDNKKVVDIARSQIKAMCLAAGKEPRFTAPNDLLGYELEVTTKVNDKEQAEITYFKPLPKTAKSTSGVPF